MKAAGTVPASSQGKDTMSALKRLRGRRILGVPLAVAAVAVTAVAVIGGGAYAAVANHAAVAGVPVNASTSLAGCVNSSRTGDHLYTNPGNFPGCPSGEAPFSLSSVAGPAGPAGPAGARSLPDRQDRQGRQGRRVPPARQPSPT